MRAMPSYLPRIKRRRERLQFNLRHATVHWCKAPRTEAASQSLLQIPQIRRHPRILHRDVANPRLHRMRQSLAIARARVTSAPNPSCDRKVSASVLCSAARHFTKTSCECLAVAKDRVHPAHGNGERHDGGNTEEVSMKGQAEMQAGAGAPRRFALPSCPQCNDLLFASAGAEFVSKSRVRHVWSCDACGHEFATSVQLSFIRARRPLS